MLINWLVYLFKEISITVQYLTKKIHTFVTDSEKNKLVQNRFMEYKKK